MDKGKKEKFINSIKKGYDSSEDNIILGTGIFNNKSIKDLFVTIPLSMMNRHGLIAGATGTGKTKTLQLITEALSAHGCPILVMDIKGDLSGISEPGIPSSKIDERQKQIGKSWTPTQYPVEFLSISNEKGVPLRATVSEFGPLLFSRILGINETQAGVVSLVFKYCDDNQLLLLDLKDFKKALQFMTQEGKEEIKKEFGILSTSSVSAILRKVIELEEQGGDIFFGEKSFDVEDLLRRNNSKQGYINVLRLANMQNYPKLFSTFMLCLLAEIYEKFPEVGEVEKPKLVVFIDEAHLIFDQAPKNLLDEIENVTKLIRSKGVGIYFCTQNPVDIPASVLGQLGTKIQHSLRAFTAKDRKAIKLAIENYPSTEFYDVDALITSMGIGEALITVLNEKGVPTPLVHTLLCAPESRMGPINETELVKVVDKSDLAEKYNKIVDRESAYEILSAKLQNAVGEGKVTKVQKSTIEKIAKTPLAKQVGRTIARELVRGFFSVLKGSSKK